MSQLAMRRPDLEGLPGQPDLPKGYRLRLGTPDDAESMGRTMTPAYQEEWSAARCRGELLCNEGVYATFVIDHEGEVVATASCKELRDRPKTGYVHYVGAHPAHTGRKLGYAVTLATLQEFRRRGLEDAILNTDDWRLPAIKVYLQLGFVPLYEDEDHPLRWSRVFRSLLRP